MSRVTRWACASETDARATTMRRPGTCFMPCILLQPAGPSPAGATGALDRRRSEAGLDDGRHHHLAERDPRVIPLDHDRTEEHTAVLQCACTVHGRLGL